MKNAKLKWYQIGIGALAGFTNPFLGLTLYWVWKDDNDELKKGLAQRLKWGVILFAISAAIYFIRGFIDGLMGA